MPLSKRKLQRWEEKKEEKKTKGQVKRGANKDTFRGVQTWSQY